MTSNLTRLTEALRRDTPEKVLMKEIVSRKAELIATVKAGKVFSLYDVCGRKISFIPSGQPSKEVYLDALASLGKRV